MELTIESAFSTGGMVGHLSYLLLVISMLMRSMTTLRLLVIGSALAAITYDLVWLKDPVGVFWETLLVTVNVIQIWITWRANRKAQFSQEEEALVTRRLTTLPRNAARRLLNRGVWLDGSVGTVLTTEGAPVQQLVYLHSGRVDITLNGVIVGTCKPGNYVGEMSVLDGASASATAIVAEPSRYWLISTEALKKLHNSDAELAGAIETGIARDLRRKILDSNTAVSQGV